MRVRFHTPPNHIRLRRTPLIRPFCFFGHLRALPSCETTHTPPFILAAIDIFPGITLMFRGFVSPLIAALLCLLAAGDQSIGKTPSKMGFPSSMPQTVVWAWQEPEDLRSAAPQSIGVAYLAETIFLRTASRSGRKNALAILPRRQPLLVAPGARVMAVARLIAMPGFHDSPELRAQTATVLALLSHQPGLRALQIDFDATRSQRAFYAAVLARLQPQMPPGMPLSITALVSWCTASPGPGDWLSSLPVDEAVPMFFRMGGSSLSGESKSGYSIREPVCRGSIGLSTDESWPPLNRDARIYLFAPRPWTPRQLAALTGVPAGSRPPALQYSWAAAAQSPPNDTGLPLSSTSAASQKPSAEEKLP